SAVISAAILHAVPAAPRQIRAELPQHLDDLILKALEKDRDIRTQTASELRAELKRLKRDLDSDPVRSIGTVATAPAVPLTAPHPASAGAHLVTELVGRHRGAVAAIALVAVLAITAVVYRELRRTAQPAVASLPSIADLQLTQLTTSGNALWPAISPDGKYVA